MHPNVIGSDTFQFHFVPSLAFAVPGVRPEARLLGGASGTSVNSLAPDIYLGIAGSFSESIDRGPQAGTLSLGGMREPSTGFYASFTWPEPMQTGPIGITDNYLSFTLPLDRRIKEEVTTEAESYASSIGLLASIEMAKNLAKRTFSSLKGIIIRLSTDPEETSYKAVNLTLVTTDDVEKVLELDEQLQSEIFEEIPAAHRTHLNITYQFV